MEQSLFNKWCWNNQTSTCKDESSRELIPFKKLTQGFPGGSVTKHPPANAGDMDSIPDLNIPDLTFCTAAKPKRHNYRLCSLEPGSCNH